MSKLRAFNDEQRLQLLIFESYWIQYENTHATFAFFIFFII